MELESLKIPIAEGRTTRESGTEKAIRLEREAQRLIEEKKTDDAFHAFDEAAVLYDQTGEYLKSAFCYASAATCWNIHAGWQPLRNAASRNETAARTAMKVKHYAYARWLFREAALLYEKEGDFEKYSECFVAAQNTHLHYVWEIFFRGRQKIGIAELDEKVSWNIRLTALLKWVLISLNRWVWGYGEKPLRTFVTVGSVIGACAAIYASAGLIRVNGAARSIDFCEALYFSAVTFATVGYGDYLPLGWIRLIAVFESMAGIFLMPLFLVALTRRYLRIYS